MEKYEFKVAIIVVTYNRLRCLKQCLDSLQKQTYLNRQIIVVDNASSDGTDIYCKEIDGITYLRLDENNGGSYGFYYAIKYSMDLNVDLIWGMDDDAYPKPDCLAKMIDVYNNGLSIDNTALWSNSLSHLPSYKPGLIEDVNWWTFVGFMLSCNMVKTIGLPRNDLFIFYDDAEYAQRILDKGYKIKKIHDAIIIHEGALNRGNISEYKTKKFLGVTIALQELPAWKRYYTVRNLFLVKKSIRGKMYAFAFAIKQGLKIALIQPECLNVWWKALFDGLRGKSGKVLLP